VRASIYHPINTSILAFRRVSMDVEQVAVTSPPLIQSPRFYQYTHRGPRGFSAAHDNSGPLSILSRPPSQTRCSFHGSELRYRLSLLLGSNLICSYFGIPQMWLVATAFCEVKSFLPRFGLYRKMASQVASFGCRMDTESTKHLLYWYVLLWGISLGTGTEDTHVMLSMCTTW